jgi:hypothetical protein
MDFKVKDSEGHIEAGRAVIINKLGQAHLNVMNVYTSDTPEFIMTYDASVVAGDIYFTINPQVIGDFTVSYVYKNI